MIDTKKLDELAAGSTFHIRKDPDDPNYEIVTHRRPAGDAVGGNPRPTADHEGFTGVSAVRRWSRLLLAEAAGIAPELSKRLMRIRERFKD